MAAVDDDRPVTIYTVAERAGVSIATVSRVLKGSTPASPMTRRKVLRAVEELDYVPLRSSRPVDVPRHQTHGLVLPGLHGPYFSDLLTGFEGTAAQYGQSVVVALAGGPVDIEDQLRTMLQRVDGLVVATATVADATVRSISRGTPTVLIARDPVEGCDAVLIENERSAAELTSHLVGHGRRHLLFVGLVEDSHDFAGRYEGFVSALRRRKLMEAGPPVRVHPEEESGPEAVDRILAMTEPVDALMCANDELALSVMAQLARRGVRVPEDLAVTGFDDIMTSRFMAPGLTTAQQPTRALGRWAAIRLHERIEGRTEDVEPLVIPTRIVLRGSCGCAWDGPSLPTPPQESAGA
ncbi:LacI family DNA-binding transcriptional regulator [Oryzobacter sp. R7]|uniref:LacI family DNA-binding transcriptional regulator n=1 Tax=Oryzobacter faecalis TaxID=3388656 RepID=UPI00398CCC1B